MAEAAWRLGLGVVLAWAALPLFVRLARRSQRASPAAYYRALVLALGMATALVVAPLARAWTGVDVALPRVISDTPWAHSTTMTFVAEWITPLLSPVEKSDSATPFALVFSAIAGVWLLLLGAGVARSLRGRIELWRSYRGAALAPSGVLARAQRVASQLGIGVPPIRVAEGLGSAFTFGVFSPVVVLGAAACQGGDAELDFTLRHELLHVAHSDTRAAFVIDLAQRCFAGHPCLGRLAAEIRFAREARVDELAAGSVPLEYARFLLALAERLRTAHAPSPALVSMADTTLERRVKMLMTSTKGSSRFWRGTGWLGLSGLTLGALVFLAPSSFGQGDAGDDGGNHARVKGNLTVEQVERAAFAEPYQGQFIHECYSQLSYPRPNLALRLLFEIDENGRVSSGRAEVPQHPELASCLEGVLKRMQFPRPTSGTVTVDLPVVLTPTLEERNARAEADQGLGQLPREVVQKVVQDSFDRMRTCYEALPRPLTTLRLNLEFTIGRDGTVIDGQVESKEHPGLASCVDGVMRSLVFPAPKTGIVTVVFPVEMSP